jgi:hypothetical protein
MKRTHLIAICAAIGLLVVAGAAAGWYWLLRPTHSVSEAVPNNPKNGESANSLEFKLVKNIKLDRFFFTVGVEGAEQRLTIQDPSAVQDIVLTFSVDVPHDGTRVFSTDFVFRYNHSGAEDRSNCKAIMGVDDAAREGFALGEYAHITLDQGKRKFSVVCPLEKDVRAIQVWHIGDDPISLFVGPDRNPSAYVTTNKPRDATYNAAMETLRTSHYDYTEETGLNTSTRGITIKYQEKFEDQANELGKKIAAATHIQPTVERVDLLSEYDVVIWLGK